MDVSFIFNIELLPGLLFAINGVPFIPPSIPVLLQILNGTDPHDLLPKGSVYYLLRNHRFSVIRSVGQNGYNYSMSIMLYLHNLFFLLILPPISNPQLIQFNVMLFQWVVRHRIWWQLGMFSSFSVAPKCYISQGFFCSWFFFCSYPGSKWIIQVHGFSIVTLIGTWAGVLNFHFSLFHVTLNPFFWFWFDLGVWLLSLQKIQQDRWKALNPNYAITNGTNCVLFGTRFLILNTNFPVLWSSLVLKGHCRLEPAQVS